MIEKARLCASNNADLYQAIFRAHGLKDRRTESCWWSEATAPPYYSNMTTLDPDATAAQAEALGKLKSILGRSFSIKDGFCRLELGALGFRKLFDAQWIWLSPDGIDRELPAGWKRVRDAVSLAAWERAWSGSSPSDRPVFPQAILGDPTVALFGRVVAGGYDAGCIANLSSEVVGLSNVFATGHDMGAAYAEASSAVASFARRLPMVGYEWAETLSIAHDVGFQSVGPLRVWLLE